MDHKAQHIELIGYVRDKIDELLEVMGTLPLRPEELDDKTLIELDPIGIIAQSFRQIIKHQNDTNAELEYAQQEILSIFNSINAAVIVIDNEQRIEDFNLHARNVFLKHYPADKLHGAPAAEVCKCDQNLLIQRLDESEKIEDFVFDGRHYMVNITTIGEPDNSTRKTIFLFTDITEKLQADANLKLYEKVFNSTAEGILIADKDSRIIEANDAFCEMSGYTQDELIGKTPKLLNSSIHNEEFYEELWEAIEAHGRWKGEIIDRRKDGSLIPLLQTINRIDDSDGNPLHYISILTDITTLKENEYRLEFLAHHDVLTKLPNRLLFHDRLEQAIARAERNKNRVGLLFIDLDHFKNINDTLGHNIGDKLLQAVGQRINKLIRKSDTLSRLGGDEFVIVLEDIDDKRSCTDFAKKIVYALKPPFAVEHHQLHINCSIGISMYPENGEDAIALLKNADTAMYRAKEAGRDGFIVYHQKHSDSTDEIFTIEGALRHALDKQEMFLHYQPIICRPEQRVIGAESLLRWNSEELGGIEPDRFIPIAETSKLIIDIGLWVFERSVEQFRAWRTAGVDIDYISINVSSMQLYNKDFVTQLNDILASHEVPASAIQIEITENIMMRDIDHCINILKALRLSGYKLAIDDFGTGYSSLSYLRTLPADLLKIDRSFISQIPENVGDNMIANAIISLAKTMDMDVVAEGIEDEAQVAFLEGIGCNQFQGFYFSKPLDAQGFERFYRSY